MSSYELLLHDLVFEQINEVTKDNQKLLDQVNTALKKIKDSPTTAGAKIRYLLPKHLEGKVYKIHVGGRTGHRLIYLVIPGKRYVIPIYLSPEIKANFSYETCGFQDIAEILYKDIKNKNMSEFRKMK